MPKVTVGCLLVAVIVAAFGQVAGNRRDKVFDLMSLQLPSAGYTSYDYSFTPDYNRTANGWCHHGSPYWRC
jgi:hypothetical protein